MAVYSDADRTSLHVRMADEAAHVGPAPSAESYLRIDRILDAARKHGAEAIHPGYGFLSENADFAAACEARGHRLHRSVRRFRSGRMGSKTAARQRRDRGGSAGRARDAITASTLDEARAVRRATHGYPVLLKAVAGGGGKGHAARGPRGRPRSGASRRRRARRSAPSATPKSTSRS